MGNQAKQAKQTTPPPSKESKPKAALQAKVEQPKSVTLTIEEFQTVINVLAEYPYKQVVPAMGALMMAARRSGLEIK